MLSKEGFGLTKWLSNREKVLNTIHEKERSKSATHSFDCAKVSGERILGVHWDVKIDNLFVAITNKRKPFTRRGIFSVICMLFDPLGFIAPVILKAKLLLQNLCRNGLGWDEKITMVKCVLGKVG